MEEDGEQQEEGVCWTHTRMLLVHFFFHLGARHPPILVLLLPLLGPHLNKVPGDVHLALLHRAHPGGPQRRRSRIHVCAHVRDEGADDAHVAILAGAVERRHAVIVRHIGDDSHGPSPPGPRGPLRYSLVRRRRRRAHELAEDALVPLCAGLMEGRGALLIVPCEGVGAVLEEEGHNLLLAVSGGKVEGVEALLVPRRGAGARLEKGPDDVHVGARDGLVERGVAVHAPDGVHVRSGGEEGVDDVHVAPADGVVERGEAVPVLGVGEGRRVRAPAGEGEAALARWKEEEGGDDGIPAVRGREVEGRASPGCGGEEGVGPRREEREHAPRLPRAPGSVVERRKPVDVGRVEERGRRGGGGKEGGAEAGHVALRGVVHEGRPLPPSAGRVKECAAEDGVCVERAREIRESERLLRVPIGGDNPADGLEAGRRVCGDALRLLRGRGCDIVVHDGSAGWGEGRGEV